LKNGEKLSRDIPIELGKSAILFIDVQYNNVYPDGGQYKGLSPLTAKIKYQYFFDTLHNIALPNMVKIQKKARKNRIEILYTTIESLTSDGRDRGLDYKISGFNIPKNSKNANLEIFNIKGQKIKQFKIENDVVLSGDEGSIIWNGNDNNGKQVSSGVYFYKLIIDNVTVESHKMLLLK